MIRCGNPVMAQRADRGVRPYRALCVFAENACNFVIAYRAGGACPAHAVQCRKFACTDASPNAPVGADDPVRPAVRIRKSERANAKPYNVSQLP